MYNSRILKSRYISVVEPVYIETSVSSEGIYIYDETENVEDKEIINPEKVAADIISKAKEDAVAILEEYQLQMEEMKSKLQDEADQYREKVINDAYDEGYNKGYSEGKVVFEVALEAVSKESERLQVNYRALLDNAEPQVVETVIAIAQKVIEEDVKLNKENLISLVKQALNISYEQQSASIKLSNKDYEYLRSNVPELISQINSYENISIKEDMTLSEGDCIVDTPFGTVDLGIDKRFEKITHEFI